MSEPVYKVSNPIVVVYQAAGASTARTIVMDVWDETQTQATTATFASSAMAELSGTGRYRDTFTPDAEGDWIVQMYDGVSGTGKVVKHYQVVGHDVDSVGDNVDAVKTKTDALPADPASQTDVETAIGDSETNIIAQIDDLESPAMVG